MTVDNAIHVNSLESKVKKIEAARKTQKQRIESNQLSKSLQSEEIERMQKPVISALQPLSTIPREVKALQRQQQAAENIQQEGAAQLEALQTLLGRYLPMLEAQQPQDFPPDFPPDYNEDLETPEVFTEPGLQPGQLGVTGVPWVQKLYSDYRRSGESRLSKCEVSLKGNIGEIGRIPMSNLFNNNELQLYVENRLLYKVDSKDMTPGIAALILLPWRDIEQSGIEITQSDKETYYTIMKYAGLKSSKSSKYQNIIKPLEQAESEEEMDIEEERTIVPRSQRTHSRTHSRTDSRTDSRRKAFGKTFGKGVFAYNDPCDLENRIGLVIGSIRAGNTSIELRNELRALLDEMLKKGYMGSNIHQKFYTKYHLI